MRLDLRIICIAGIFGLNGVLATAATPWESYMDSLSPEKARMVKKVGYSSKEIDNEQEGFDWQLFETQILALDPAAIDLAFRLNSKNNNSDETESLNIVLECMNGVKS